MTILETLGIAGILALVFLLMVWLISRALRRGYVHVDPFFWIESISLFEIPIRRATLPIFFWLIVLGMMAFALALLIGMGAALIFAAVTMFHK